jgi:hypothetical protein
MCGKWYSGEQCAACHCVDQFDARCHTNSVLCMHLPPLLGKVIDFPGGYSSVDCRWGGFWVSVAFTFSSKMKGLAMYSYIIKENKQQQFHMIFITCNVVPVCAMKACRLWRYSSIYSKSQHQKKVSSQFPVPRKEYQGGWVGLKLQ